MSSGNRIPLTQAEDLAAALVEQLRPYCARIEVAGSIRRQRETIGDIELVIIPKRKPILNLFNQVAGYASALDEWQSPYPQVRGKERNRRYDLGPTCADLWITTPERWGSIFTIRTGCAAFSHWLVSPKNMYGGCPGGCAFEAGRLIWYGKPVDTFEEADLFRRLDLAYLDPRERTLEGAWGKLPNVKKWWTKHPEYTR